MYFFFRNLSARLILKPVSLKVRKNNSRDKKLKDQWDRLIIFLSERFSDGEALDVEGVLYLIGFARIRSSSPKYEKR